jgi:hypothetical protein
MAGGRRAAVEPLIRLIVNAVVPVLVYLLLRPHTRSDLTALIIGAAIPAAYTVGFFLWRRRMDPIGAIALLCFAVGLLLVIATSGNELVFKLRAEIWTGPLGLACLISAAVRRPLLVGAMQIAARRNPVIAERLGRPQAHRILTVSTVVVGAILLVHAVLLVALALTTSTTTFLALSRPISWVVVGGGLAALALWIRHRAGGNRFAGHRDDSLRS